MTHAILSATLGLMLAAAFQFAPLALPEMVHFECEGNPKC